jgi:hypothetical protein
MQPHGKLGECWERHLKTEAEQHFQELASITYEIFTGRTKYSPKHEELFVKLFRNDTSWLINDMIWFNDKS